MRINYTRILSFFCLGQLGQVLHVALHYYVYIELSCCTGKLVIDDYIIMACSCTKSKFLIRHIYSSETLTKSLKTT